MGTNAAVSLANFYLWDMDRNAQRDPAVSLYFRYIDDIFVIKRKGIPLNLESWIHGYNNLRFSSIQCSPAQVDFLDLTIYFSYGCIHWKTYQKPMNQYLYLPWHSNHPRSHIKGFIFSELTRYQRTNSEPENYEFIKNLFRNRLLLRGYPKRAILSYFHAFHTKPAPEPKKPLIPFVLPYTGGPYAASLASRIRRLFSESTSQIIPGKELKLVFSTRKNIRDLLLRSSLSEAQSSILLKRKQEPNLNEPRQRARIEEPFNRAQDTTKRPRLI
jgi:hypothetical protein